MSLESKDILWVLDLVTSIEEDLQSINVRLSNLERVFKSTTSHVTNILQSNSDIQDNALEELTGVSTYVSNLSKKVVQLEDIYNNTKSNKHKSIYS